MPEKDIFQAAQIPSDIPIRLFCQIIQLFARDYVSIDISRECLLVVGVVSIFIG